MRRWILAGAVWVIATAASAQDVTLSVEGDNDDLQAALEAASLTLTLSNEADPVPQDYVAAARADYRRLLTALYAAGRYSGTVSIRVNGTEAETIAPLGAPSRIRSVDIKVDPGPRFVFGRAEVAPLAPGTVLPEAFAPGRGARSERIANAARTGVEGWRAAGHAKATVADQSIVARHPVRELDAVVRLAPGPQLTFGPLSVSGNNLVRESAIRRIAGLPVGQVYDPEELSKAAQRLRRTGAFDSVAFVEADRIGAGDTLPIALQLEEAKLRRLGFGIEVSSLEGFSVSTYWLHRNALGGAERFRIEAEVAGIGGDTGGVDYRVAASLGIPAVIRKDTELLARAEISREDEPDYLIDKVTVETSLFRQITDARSGEVGIGLLAAREETPQGEREYVLLTLPLSGTLELRDNPTDAKNGYYLNLDLEPFVSLKGSANGGRIYGDARAYRSFGENDRVTLAARGQIGSLIGADETNAPADFLFYSGGGGTVRGQAYKSLGVERTADGETFTGGGLSFVGAQLEARVGVTDSIGVVGFYDAGWIGETAVPFEDGDWHAGVGIGLRYNTGIGPIRLDVGTPANGDDAFGSVDIYIGIGQAF